MAQAVVDLPDPADPQPVSIAQTDELISQMAGNDIDRLLADAQIDAPKAPAEPSPTDSSTESPAVAPEEPMSPLAADEAALSAQLDDLFNELQQEPAEPEEPAAAESPESAPESLAEPPAEASAAQVVVQAEQPVAAAEAAAQEAKDTDAPQGEERAALLEAAGFEAPPAPSPATEQTPAVASAATPIAASPDPVHEAAPSGPERSALLAAAGFDTDPNAPALEIGPNPDPSKQNLDTADGASLPILLKPLEWMNAPVRSSPLLRQSLGRAAVITLINALAVLTYVLVFRKH